MINVTQTFLPNQEVYQKILSRAWSSGWMTNRGKLVIELEEILKDYLDSPYLTLTTNGTLPIQIAIKALDLSGEIITTPFSYVATTSSIIWENCTPVFVDIDQDYLTIDTAKIEEAITDKTSAIIATHVFGNPCDVEKLEEIAKKYNLKIIYDAAHCFGVRYKGKSIFNYGDVSTCSFHATKVFHTGEGGCMVSKDSKLHDRLYFHHNFGHDGPEKFHGLGINAKMSELQAAMGLAVFPHFDEILQARKLIIEYYNDQIDLTKIKNLKIRNQTEWNYSYYPIILNSESDLLSLQNKLNEINIYPRRYFYPALNTIDYVGGEEMKIAESIASRILCLPLFVGLERTIQDRIINIINEL